jgi:hypothetical protein
MKNLLLAFCVLLVSIFLAAPTSCFAQTISGDTINGVLAEERVVNLPQDAGKWYISVVGDSQNTQYQTIVGWFDTNTGLKKLKDQVHFIPVTSDSVMYKERYAPNVKGLPTVRLQDSQGVVAYEASGTNLPFTAEGLYASLANGVNKTQRGYILPYRRNNSRPCPTPNPDPAPDVTPDGSDPAPQPLDNNAKPVAPDAPAVEGNLPPLWLMLGVLLVAGGIGVLVEWRAVSKDKG